MHTDMGMVFYLDTKSRPTFGPLWRFFPSSVHILYDRLPEWKCREEGAYILTSSNAQHICFGIEKGTGARRAVKHSEVAYAATYSTHMCVERLGAS